MPGMADFLGVLKAHNVGDAEFCIPSIGFKKGQVDDVVGDMVVIKTDAARYAIPISVIAVKTIPDPTKNVG